MRIGLNLLYLIPKQVGGVERYAAGLLTALASIDKPNEYVVFVNKEAANWRLPNDSRFSRVVCPVKATSRWQRYLFEQTKLPLLLKQQRLNVVHSLNYVTPLAPSIPSLVTIHDLNYKAFGHLMPMSKRLALSFFVRQSAKRADQIITDSDFSRREIMNTYQLEPHKVHVLYPGAPTEKLGNGSFQTISQQLNITSPYIIAFSSRTPNKNIYRLLQAYQLMRQKYQITHQLVLVGHLPADLSFDIQEQNSGICVTGYLDDDRLDQILAHAQCLVFPSTYEGFGLPILEAMSAGVAVVSSTAGSLPEVGGDAARYFDPYDVEAMAATIYQVISNAELRAELCQKAQDNLTRFSWTDTAKKAINLYQQVVTRPPNYQEI